MKTDISKDEYIEQLHEQRRVMTEALQAIDRVADYVDGLDAEASRDFVAAVRLCRDVLKAS